MSLYVRPYSVAITFMDDRTKLVRDVNCVKIDDGVLHLQKRQMTYGEIEVKGRGSFPIVNIREWDKEGDEWRW